MSTSEENKDLVLHMYMLYKVKRRGGVGQKYKNFFFSLRRASSEGTTRLEYGNSKDFKVICLDNVLVVQARNAKSMPNKFAFQVICNEACYHFACETGEDRRRWLESIRDVVFGKKEKIGPGEYTFEVEIDDTNSSRQLHLHGLYILEITASNLILWLPRSRQETVRWSLMNIHNMDWHRPRDADMDRLTVELNQFSATGPGTLMFKLTNARKVKETVENFTGRRFMNLNQPIRGKSLRKKTTSQEDVRDAKNYKGPSSLTLQPFACMDLAGGLDPLGSSKRSMSFSDLLTNVEQDSVFVDRSFQFAAPEPPPIPLRSVSQGLPSLQTLPRHESTLPRSATLPGQPGILVTPAPRSVSPRVQPRSPHLSLPNGDSEFDSSGGESPASEYSHSRSASPMPGAYLPVMASPTFTSPVSPPPVPPPRPEKTFATAQPALSKSASLPLHFLGSNSTAPPAVPPRPVSTLRGGTSPTSPPSPSAPTQGEDFRAPLPPPRPLNTLRPQERPPVERKSYENVDVSRQLPSSPSEGSAFSRVNRKR